ncbi:MAG: rhodanese-like domain-containing protein [Planctomycetota bacterium]|nr:MAG: rhodanese-like domain-containing protein [Planctomycetota bacterium]
MCCGYLVLVPLVTGCGTNQFQREVETEAAAIKLVDETLKGRYSLIATDELRGLISSGDEFVLVDAMPAAASYEKGHLEGAVNFEFPKEVLETWDERAILGGSKSDYEKLLGDDKDRKIVVYCGFVKCARSHNAAIFAQQVGYTNVSRYPGGIYAWRGAGHPLTAQ